MNQTPQILNLIQDTLSQSTLPGDAHFSGGAHFGSADQPAQPGSLALEGSIRKSLAVAARAVRATSQSIADSTGAVITFSAAPVDPFRMWSAALPTRLTAYASGIFAFGAQLSWAASLNGVRYIDIKVNGSVYIGSKVMPGLNLTQHMSATALYYLNEGDYVEFSCWQNSGGALNVVTGNGIHLLMTRIA